ncbi:hypothetical protein [Virgibacillus sp. SK37]|uniref:hypothetical protein n=1 Tax=Virgibacillus sp. SK37 TaxID=403957 RepID=UPI0011AAF81C|nr:hypothetical protein [Virgibacillus sp. SK37]
MVNKLISYFYIIVGVLIGIIIVSAIRHGEMNWMYIGRTIAISALVFFSLWFIRIGIKKSR